MSVAKGKVCELRGRRDLSTWLSRKFHEVRVRTG